MSKKWDVSFTVNGFLAGLVAITCPCYWVSPTGSILLGGIAGVIVVGGVELLEYLRIDDPIGAVPVHGMCGIWGTLSLGLFACGKYGATGPFAADNSAPLKGLFYGGGTQVLIAQFIGSAIITVSTFAVAMVVMYAVNAMGLLRVSPEGEAHGLDLHEHGISAYPEYVISAMGKPSAVVLHSTGALGNEAPAPGRPSSPPARTAVPGSSRTECQGRPAEKQWRPFLFPHVYHFEFAPTKTAPRIRISEPHQMPARNSARTTGFAGGTNSSHIPWPMIRTP